MELNAAGKHFEMSELSQASHSTRECASESELDQIPEEVKPPITKPQMVRQWFNREKN